MTLFDQLEMHHKYPESEIVENISRKVNNMVLDYYTKYKLVPYSVIIPYAFYREIDSYACEVREWKERTGRELWYEGATNIQRIATVFGEVNIIPGETWGVIFEWEC